MKRLITTFITFMLMGSSAYAHKGMEHVMETVSSTTDTSITVTTMDGKVLTVNLTSDIKYAKMDTATPLKNIKIGDHVVIHATKKDNKLVAATVKIGRDLCALGVDLPMRVGAIAMSLSTIIVAANAQLFCQLKLQQS